MPNIQIALAPKRGEPPVFLMVDTDHLSADQLRVVREYLPVDRKTGHPILRGLDKEHRSRDLMIPDANGELQPIKFKFDLPASVQDTDGPALLDKWHQLLKEAKGKGLKRIERAQARAEKERQKAAKEAAKQGALNESAAQRPEQGGEAADAAATVPDTAQDETSAQNGVEAGRATAGPAAGGQGQAGTSIPHEGVDQSAGGLGEVMALLQLVDAFDARAAATLPPGAPTGEEGNGGAGVSAAEASGFGPEPPPVDVDQADAAEPPWERDEPPIEGEWEGGPEGELAVADESGSDPVVGEAVGQRQARRAASVKSPYDDAYAVLRKLPLLDDFEVDPFPSTEALVLPPAHTGDQFRVDDDQRPVVRGAILQVLTFDLKAMKFRSVMVDVEECLGQEWADLRQSLENEEDLELRLTQAQDLARGVWEEFRHLAGEMQWKAARGRKPLPSLGQLTDLARHLRIDLETARHTREQLLADMKAHPGWVAQVAAAIEQVHASGLDINQCTSVPALHGAFVRWAEAIGQIDTYAQLSLWATSDYERLHKSLEVQVHRARMWLEQLQRNPVGAGAAVSMLVLGC